MTFIGLTLKSSSLIIKGDKKDKEDKDDGENFEELNNGNKSSLNVRINVSELGELCSCLKGGNCILKSIARRRQLSR
jgi:hypothetical protein